MLLEFINQIEIVSNEVGIDQLIYNMKILFLTMYMLCLTLNYGIFIDAKRSKKIAMVIFLPLLEAVYLCFYLLWMGGSGKKRTAYTTAHNCRTWCIFNYGEICGPASFKTVTQKIVTCYK